MLFYLLSPSPLREGKVSHCSGILSRLVGRGEMLLWLSLDLSCWARSGGGRGLGLFLVMVQKFFNRSPITLKFGAEKFRERESRKRERESESESERERDRK